MKMHFKLILFLLTVLIVPALCQASTTILTNVNPNHTVISGSDEKVYGTSGTNEITLESAAKAELINFPGQNSIQIQSSSDLFSVSRSGTVVTFEGSDRTVLNLAATKYPQTISFNGEESRVLQIHNNQVMLDDQVITTTPAPIENYAKNNMIGSWLYDADGLDYSAVVTFIDDTNYMFAVDGEPDDGGGRGMERGVYDWNPLSGEMMVSALSQTAGDWGVSDFNTDTLTVVVSNDTLYFDTNDGLIQFTKISSADNPIIGSWLYDADGQENSAVLIFIDDTNYMFAVDGEPDDGGGRGMERGTYIWDASSGAFSAVVLSNTAGDWGISSLATSTQSVFISDDTLSYDLTDDEVIQFKKIKYAVESEDNNAECGAYVAPNVWKEFDCYNLAAIGKDLGHDPFTPSWTLIGGYWQWGRKGPDSSIWHTANTEHFAHGPTGPGLSETNEGEIIGWDQIYASDGAWSDSYKTGNDPCPEGFRIPTRSQWDGVIESNTQRMVGTWDLDDPNYFYSFAQFLGDKLMLPAAGLRSYSGALLYLRYGYYWSSSEITNSHVGLLSFNSGAASTGRTSRLTGLSVRCISE